MIIFMVSPKIQDGIYNESRRATLQADLEKNYENVSRFEDIESAQISEGFAYLEDLVPRADYSSDCLRDQLAEMVGGENIRFTQPIPTRFRTAQNKGYNCFAVYIRYTNSLVPAEKSVNKVPKKKLNIPKPLP